MISGLGLLAEQMERLRTELEARAFYPGNHPSMQHVEYCAFCSFSRGYIEKNGHGVACILRVNTPNG